MKRLSYLGLVGLLGVASFSSELNAQQADEIGDEITAAELAQLGWAMPPENVMVIVIKHTGSNRDAFCQIHNETRGKRADAGDVEPGKNLLAAIETNVMPGTIWIQCIEEGDGRRFTSDNIRSVGRTLVEFSTGSKFVITRKIVP